MIHTRHYVDFYSPGTFVSEVTRKPIASWMSADACAMAKGISERYGAKPYAFRFVTMRESDPIDDGHGGKMAVEPKELTRSGMHFITGRLRTIADVERDADPNERILLSNMKGNGYPIVVENCNSYKSIHPFTADDFIVDWNGNVIERGNARKHTHYRKKARAV